MKRASAGDRGRGERSAFVGVSKAALVLEHIEDIKKFVAENAKG